jgi:hypothetical protein
MKKQKSKDKKKSKKYQQKPKVHCSNCPAFIDEDKTKFVNIEEDIQGVDVLTFICPECKTKQKSRIFI